MTHREDNALLDRALEAASALQSSGTALQVAAAAIVLVGIVTGCILVLHFQVPM